GAAAVLPRRGRAALPGRGDRAGRGAVRPGRLGRGAPAGADVGAAAVFGLASVPVGDLPGADAGRGRRPGMSSTRRRRVLLAVLALAIYSCSKKEEAAAPPPPPPPAQKPAPSAPRTGTSSITGDVKLEGEPPQMQPLKRGVDPVCAKKPMNDEQ